MNTLIKEIVIVKSLDPTTDQKYHSRIMAHNNYILWSSESYSSLAMCKGPAMKLAELLNIPIKFKQQ